MYVHWEQRGDAVYVYSNKQKQDRYDQLVSERHVPFQTIELIAVLFDEHPKIYGGCFQPGMSSQMMDLIRTLSGHFLHTSYDERSDDSESEESDEFDGECFNCGEYGHTAYDCIYECDQCHSQHALDGCPLDQHWIYVLQLAGNRYYVGETTDLDERINQHKSGGAAWTRKHKFVREVKRIDVDYKNRYLVEFMETIELMSANGIDKVRGACFCRINYTAQQKIAMAKLIAYCMSRPEADVLMQNNLI